MPLLMPRLPSGTKHYGMLARFTDAAALYHGCEKVRDAGYKQWDSHTPFPVHGLERAMGLKSSRLPWIVLVMGLSGAAGGMLLQWWVHAKAYALTISGKPTDLFAWPAYVPVTFELGILGAALGAVLGMLALNQLPMFYHPLFHSKQFESFSNDAFFVSVEATDPLFDESKTRAALLEAGATHVELVDH